jgi:seryl-tRNA synthetase
MLDIKRIRDNADAVNRALQRRNPELSVDDILAIDGERRKLLTEEESLRSRRNQLTKEIAQVKKADGDAEALLAESKQLADRIKDIEAEKEVLAERQQALLLTLPNTPQDCVPSGASDADNPVVRTWGEQLKGRPPVEPLAHYEIGVQLGVLDFERGVKVAKSRFSVYRGAGSQLVRALINFMLDLHTEHGYTEVLPPFMVNREAMTGTGQLPKFESDMFKLDGEELFLIPTAEVPVTNLYADEILSEEQLPLHLTAYTPCFRREAGSAGQDTRGLIRQHQFDKIELVKLVKPEDSEAEHEKLVADAERVLQRLELPYRVVELCTGDLGFSASRCFDLEVWMPAQGRYREISSCSNFLDFQARRASLKYKHPETGKPAFLHTLNGSGLAVGRTVAAILENYQTPDGDVVIPEALRPYFRNRITTLKASSHECRILS